MVLPSQFMYHITPVTFSSPSQAWEPTILPTTASVYFPSVGRGKYWFGDRLLPYPRRKPSSFTLGFGRRNFKKIESLVVLMWTFRLGLLPEGENEKTGGCYFTSWASQHEFGAKVVIRKHFIHLVTQHYDTPTGIEKMQVILRSQKTGFFFFLIHKVV